MVPRSLLNTGIALTSLGGALGFRDRNSDFLEENTTSTQQKLVETGIGAATTAATLAGTFFSAAQKKNPYLTAIGMALSAGGAYATTRVYKQEQTQKMMETGDTTPSLASRLLDGATQLGALYYGGKALAPFVARSVSRMDMEAQPWFHAMGQTVEQARLGNVGEWGNIFTENLNKSRSAFSTIDRRFPVQQHLNVLNRIQTDISNVSLRQNAQDSMLNRLMQKYSVTNRETVNGIRQATLQDGINQGSAIYGRTITRAGYKAEDIALGKGVFYDEVNKKILNLHKYTPENVITNAIQGFAKNFKIPILGFNPVSVLRPNEIINAIKTQHGFHVFPQGTPLGPTLKAGGKGAAYIGGDLFDIESGKYITSGNMFKTGAFHNEVINGQTNRVFRETAAGEILRKRYGAGMGKEGTKLNFGNRVVEGPKNAFQKFMTETLEMDIPLVHKTGFSEYASTIEKLTATFKERPGVKGGVEAVSAAYKGVFDPEGIIGSSSKSSAFPTTKTKWGEQAFGFVPHSDLPGALAFWQANRTTRLMEGIGLGNFNPQTTKSASDVMWKMVFKRALPLYLSYKMLQFSNDMGHKLFGYGPLDIPADIIANFNVGAAHLRHALHIDDLANYLEGLMPGSMSASGPALARGFGLPILGGAKYGVKGALAGGAISAFLGGSSGQILKKPEDIKAEYFGDRRVAIRGGRWWEMGSGPFEGGKIKYYVPNWYRRLKSRYQYTDVQYGSEGEYWSNILDPYHYAIKHYNDRPYPMVTSGFETVPFVGPLLAGALAPPMMMHQDFLNNLQGGGEGIGPGVGGTGAGIGGGAYPIKFEDRYIAGEPEQGAPYGIAAGIGGKGPAEAISPTSLKGRVGQEIYGMNEYLGMYGFLGNAVKAQLTGNQNYFTQPQLESAERISSAERAYWEKDLGGLFENTELFRRFLPHRRHDIDYLNPVPNTQPDWMPGSDYFTNFKIGDPYAKINYGEFRAPGSGYEKFYTPGAGIQKATVDIGKSNLDMADGYSPLDQYRILSDVAPYSKQAKYAKQYIMALDKAGGLTPEASAERKRIAKEATARKKNYQFKNRVFTGGTLRNEDAIVGTYLGKGRFTVKGQKNTVYKLAGLKGINEEGDEYLSSIIRPGERLTVQTLDDDRYRKKTGTSIPTVPVLLGDINRNLIKRNMAEYKKTGPEDVYAPLNTRVQYNALERGIGTAWEDFSHSNIPFFGKFLHERTALEEYEDTQVYGTGQADWQHPIRDFVMPYVYRARASNTLKAIAGGGLLALFGTNKKAKVAFGVLGAVAGGLLSLTGDKDYIPEYREKERDINQYYDILNYLKNQRLYNYSRAKAIEEEGVDPGEILRSVEASREARQALSKALKQKYGEASLDKLYDTEFDDEEAQEEDLDAKYGVEKARQFLQRQKYTEDEVMRLSQGGYTGAALEFHKRYTSTEFGADPHGDFASIMRALPTKEREFFQSFVTAPKKDRERIKKIAPLGMRRMLEAKWGEPIEDNPNLDEYFQNRKLPNDSWVGWHPAVDLNDVKLRTVQQEGLDMHDFNLWESQARELSRKPYVPLIDPFSAKGNHHNMKRELQDILTAQGYNNYDIYLSDYAGSPDNQISLDVKFATDTDARDYVKSHIRKLVSPAYIGS